MAAPESLLQSTPFMPVRLNRQITQNDLDASDARILQNCDILFFENRLRRGPGSARTQATGASAVVQSCFAATRRDCKMLLIDYTGGTIRVTPSDGTVACTGPLPLWQDTAGSGSFVNEDLGVNGGGTY
jgi:hypothetical protein